jgi:hypothetical protein
MTREPFLPCPCGCTTPPRPVVERGARKQKVLRVRCRDCRLTSLSARPERVPIAWNAAVERELLRRRDEAGIVPYRDETAP